MKTINKILTIVFLFTLTALPFHSKAEVSVSFQFFYDNLSPYGNWVYHPTWGNVWVPGVGPGFRPYYTDGRWAYTEYGWTWASDYEWGWAPFHYGTWTYDPYYGWMWIPDYDWAPAWVSWGYYDGYYGWAPISPSYSYQPAINYWVFVQPAYIAEPSWRNHCYVSSNNRITINKTTYINNPKKITVVNNTNNYKGRNYRTGPSKTQVEKVSNKKIPVYSVQDNSQPGKNVIGTQEVKVYRPRIKEDKNTSKPVKVQAYEKNKGVEQNIQPNQKAGNKVSPAPMQNSGKNNVQPKVPKWKEQKANDKNVNPALNQQGMKQNKIIQKQQDINSPKEEQQPQHQQPLNQGKKGNNQPQNLPEQNNVIPKQDIPQIKEKPLQQQPGGFDRPLNRPRFQQPGNQQPNNNYKPQQNVPQIQPTTPVQQPTQNFNRPAPIPQNKPWHKRP